MEKEKSTGKKKAAKAPEETPAAAKTDVAKTDVAKQPKAGKPHGKKLVAKGKKRLPRKLKKRLKKEAEKSAAK